MRWHAATTVAIGGAPNGPPRCCPGDRDGHLMPLSPTVRGRYDSTVRHCSHCSRTVATTTPFTILPLSPTLTPVGDPLPYKRRPVCNVERVRSVRFGQSSSTALDPVHTLGA